MVDLLSSAATLATSAADTRMKGKQIDEQARQANLNALQASTENIANLVKTKMSEQGAMDRQTLQGEQGIELEREKQKYQNITITPQIAKGLAQHSGTKELEDLAGTTMPVEKVLGLYTQLKDAKPITFNRGGEVITIFKDPRTGEWTEEKAPRDIRETTPGAGRGGGSTGMTVANAKLLFPDIDFGKTPDDTELSPSVLTNKIAQSPTAMKNLMKLLALQRDPIMGGLKEGAQEDIGDVLSYVQNVASKTGKTLVYVPPGLDDSLPEGGTALIPSGQVAELSSKGVRPITYETEKKKK